MKFVLQRVGHFHWPMSALRMFVHLNVTLSTEVKSTWTHRHGSCCWPRRRTMWSTLVTAPCWRGWRRPWLAPSTKRTLSLTTTLWGPRDIKQLRLYFCHIASRISHNKSAVPSASGDRTGKMDSGDTSAAALWSNKVTALEKLELVW